MELLREPLYRLAAEYSVANYVMTPLMGQGMAELDPYAPLLRLWMLGAKPVACWGRLGDGVRVYVSRSPGA